MLSSLICFYVKIVSLKGRDAVIIINHIHKLATKLKQNKLNINKKIMLSIPKIIFTYTLSNNQDSSGNLGKPQILLD